MLKESVNRSAWTSESVTGMFTAFKHKHVGLSISDIIQPFYYSRTLGFRLREHAVDIVEGFQND